MSLSRKQITNISRILIVLCAIVIFAMPTANAKDYKKQIPYKMAKMITNSVPDIVTKTFDINGTSEEGALFRYVNGDGATENFPNIINDVFNALFVVGGLMIIGYTLVMAFQEINAGKEPDEVVVKCLKDMLIALFMTSILIPMINHVIIPSGQWVIEQVQSQFTVPEDPNSNPLLVALFGDDTNTTGALSDYKRGGLRWWLECTAILLIPWLASLLVLVMTWFTSFSVLFELAIRRAFLPLYIGDIYMEGTHSKGFMYLKKLFGVYLKIAIILFVSILLGSFTTVLATQTPDSSFTGVIEYIFKIVAINFSAIGVMMKAGEYTNDL